MNGHRPSRTAGGFAAHGCQSTGKTKSRRRADAPDRRGVGAPSPDRRERPAGLRKTRVKNDPTGTAIAVASLPLPAIVLAVIAAGHAPTAIPSRSASVTIPVPALVRPKAEPADRVDVAAYSRAEIRCLARAMWNEAGNQSREGKIAVAEVVIARSKDRRWKGSLCQTIRMAAQFSFVRNGRTVPLDDPKTAQSMMDLARAVAAGKVSSRAKGALYYHADYAHPVWRHGLRRKIAIQTHVFYADALPKKPKPKTAV